ncbi:MAG: sulfate adenylyltransferase subunit CysN [Acidobacteriia bacterium]|nr:sulfate adenylyltransferase subunit CysN [Terriglobia bacterium]
MAAETIDDFLRRHESSELLRFTTAGSVDDGKSTLIGRLLYDTKGVYEDQLASIKSSRINRSTGSIDFSLLTDGLKAEREQGITIDVAYRYFATAKRKFIIADTPGHEQYTRNMATGASTATLAIVLIDARKGVLPQSRRHAYISSLLGIPNLVVAVNKMDLVDFSQEVFEQIRRDFTAFAAQLDLPDPVFIPISALDGDNVVSNSPRTSWYNGPNLLHHLETAPISVVHNYEDFRLAVQYVIRPDLDFRGYAGQIASGAIRPGAPVMVLPSGRTSKVKSIATFDGNLDVAFPPMSITLTLEDELDISRGDMLVDPAGMPHVSRRVEAALVWMNQEPLELNRPYLLKHTTQQIGVTVTAIEARIDVNTLAQDQPERLQLNEIGIVSLETTKPLFYDPYTSNRATGSLILIDPTTNATLAAGMLRHRRTLPATQAIAPLLNFEAGRLTPAERYARAGHLPATVWLTARAELVWSLERKLFERGCLVQAIADDVESHRLPEVARILNSAGLIAICSSGSNDAADLGRAEELVGSGKLFAYNPSDLSPKDDDACNRIIRDLEKRGILTPADFASGEGI